MNEEVRGETCEASGASQPRLETHPSRDMKLGALAIERALPFRERRMVGAWCFLDRFGPLSFTDGRPMDVAPHPHIGLQTVTWLLEGEVAHGDSLGCEALARPGAVNVMTSGDGIAHAEWTPSANTGRLNGVQLWLALPDEHRRTAADFQHVPEVPVADVACGQVSVFAGTLAGVTSPARHHSAVVGADVNVRPRQTLVLGLDRAHEHAALVLEGDVALEGQPLAGRSLHYFGLGRNALELSSAGGGRFLLIGGPPFPERILMWWNFVARAPEEIAAARADWEQRRRFGEVAGYDGPRLDAPPLQRLARPDPMS